MDNPEEKKDSNATEEQGVRPNIEQTLEWIH